MDSRMPPEMSSEIEISRDFLKNNLIQKLQQTNE